MKKKFDHEEQKRIAREKLTDRVLIRFAIPLYNYTIDVGSGANLDRMREAFVGKYFDMGDETFEDLQKCVGIKFIPAVPRPYFYDEYGFVEFN